MHRSSEVMRPKTKVAVELQRADGSVIEGHVYLAGSERVLDLLNNSDQFVPLEVTRGKFVLINKSTVFQVEPFDDSWMTAGYMPPPVEPFRPHT